jgi:hypothetical protein
MQHDLQLRAAAHAIYDACYPSETQPVRCSLMRRKVETPVVKSWMPWGTGHPVARMIATGDPWFRAWCFQACTILPALARKSGVSIGRLDALDRGDRIRRDEHVERNPAPRRIDRPRAALRNPAAVAYMLTISIFCHI